MNPRVQQLLDRINCADIDDSFELIDEIFEFAIINKINLTKENYDLIFKVSDEEPSFSDSWAASEFILKLIAKKLLPFEVDKDLEKLANCYIAKQTKNKL